MSDEKYPLLEIGIDEERMFFTSNVQDQACIGHLRGDFGCGTEFWTTWWDHREDLKDQDFKDELDDVVNALRKDGPLKDLTSMQRFCREHSQTQMSPQSGSEYYGLRVDTAQHRYYLRFCPMRGNYNFYIYCYKAALLTRPITVLVVEPTRPCHVQEIPNTLEAMGQIVGGRIESFSYQREAIISNEESKLLGLPLNRPLYDDGGTQIDMLRGTFFIAGVDGEHLTSLTDDQIQRFKALYDSMAAERPAALAEIAPDATMLDFAVACQISFRFTDEVRKGSVPHDAFISYVTRIFNNDETLAERTVGDLDITFQGRCAEVWYTFARQDKDAASAEMFSKQCVLDVRDKLEEYGCKIIKIECFAEELEPDHMRNPVKGRGNQEKKKGTHHER